MTALVWLGIGFAAAPGPATRTSAGTGRAVMSAMRTVNDVRVISRGRGASGACCAGKRSAHCGAGRRSAPKRR